jgi:Zn-dependent protease
VASTGPTTCPDCGTELAPALLACPTCHRLVHAAALKELAATAERQQRSGDAASTLATWRQALALLPPDSRQREALAARVAALDQQVGSAAATAASEKPSWVRRAGPIGLLALLLWKFKSIAGFVLSKGTVLTMLASIGIYWTAWGWSFAIGLVLAMYLHEIGHVVQLRLYGVRASAPMFVPGLGAFVRHPPLGNREQHARVALAGPLFGLGVTLLALAAQPMLRAPVLAGIAQWTARLNLFNLVPVPPLDGGTAFQALGRGQRWLVALAAGAALYQTGEQTLWLVLLPAGLRALAERGPADEADWTTFAEFAFLVIALGALATIAVPIPGKESSP